MVVINQANDDGREAEGDVEQRPRDYQLQLLERAKEGNVISVLGTGSGKTLVSVLLLKHVWDEECLRVAKGLQKRTSFFVCNHVPLVVQQAHVIQKNSALGVKALIGEDGIDYWSTGDWDEAKRAFDVIVCTAQILLDGLVHGRVNIDQINVLCFDEAHHVCGGQGKQGSHPFARIMSDFYFAEAPENRPKVFGMTASPMASKTGDFEIAAEELEARMDAKILTATAEYQDELRLFAPKPIEIIVEYDAPLIWPATALTNLIGHSLEDNTVFKRLWSQADNILREYGPVAVDLFWRRSVTDLEEKLQTQVMIVTNPEYSIFGPTVESERKGEGDQVVMAKTREKQSRKAAATEEVLGFLRSVLRQAPPVPTEIELSPQALSPKLLKLLEILEACGSTPRLREELCGIVFVEQRNAAFVLCDIISRVPGLSFIKASPLTGHGSEGNPGRSGKGREGMGWKSQRKILNQFKRRKINILIATSVAEEGLDIQPCNVVIRFNLFTSHVSYIQSRGRARRPNSHYIVMIERDNLDQLALCANIAGRADAVMTEWLKSLPDDRISEETTAWLRAEQGEEASLDADDERCYIQNERTKAKVTPKDAVKLVHLYCTTLTPTGTTALKPMFEVEKVLDFFQATGWICTIKMPSNSHVRRIQSAPHSSMHVARRMAAFKLCKELYETGILDEHFLPPRRVRPMVSDEQAVIAGPDLQGIRAYNRMTTRFWRFTSVFPGRLFATLLRLGSPDVERFRPLLLLTRKPLPPLSDFDLVLESGTSRFAAVQPRSVGSIDLTAEEVHNVHQFTIRLFELVTRTQWVCDIEDMPYFLIPIKRVAAQKEFVEARTDVDWDEVALGARVSSVPLSLSSPLDEILVADRGGARASRRSFVVRLRTDLNPFSQYEVKPSHFTTYFDQYVFNLNKRNIKLDAPLACDASQPLLEINSSGTKVINNLKSTNLTGPPSARAVNRIVIPQFSHQHSISATVFRAGLLFPSIITWIERLLMAHELNERLFGAQLDYRLLSCSVTAPSYGVKWNYEVLEWYGDSFLKNLTSIFVFVSDVDAHEGKLHTDRKKLIQNRSLAPLVLNNGLYEYIAADPFHPNEFWPPNFRIDTSNDSPSKKSKKRVQATKQILHEKCLADVFEACLAVGGLAGTDMGLKAALSLGLDLGTVKIWSDFAYQYDLKMRDIRSERAKLARKPVVEKVEACLGYNFKDPSLVLEALCHPSLLGTDLPSYQRLEFLGDALLDFFVVDMLYSEQSAQTEGDYTAMKSAMVSNNAYGALCEATGLYRFLNHNSEPMLVAITDYVEIMEERRLEEESSASPQPYWLKQTPPKAMADVVESLIGAVLVDADFDLKAPRKVFEELYRPWLATFVNSRAYQPHHLGTLLAKFRGMGCLAWHFDMSTSDLPQSTKTERVRCRILMHDREIGSAVDTSHTRAQERASESALRLIHGTAQGVLDHCNCRVKQQLAESDCEGTEEAV